MRRNVGPFFLILLVLGGLGGFTWMTRYPGSPWIERAQDWPVVGDLAREFRRAYLGPDAVRDAGNGTDLAGVPEAETVHPSRPVRLPSSAAKVENGGAGDRDRRTGSSAVAEPDEPLVLAGEPAGATTEPENVAPLVVPVLQPPRSRSPSPRLKATPRIAFQALEWKWFLPGQPVLENAGGEALFQLETLAYLPVLGRDGGWLEILYEGERAWTDSHWQPPHRRRGASRGILRNRFEPVQHSDLSKLHRVRKKFGLEESDVTLGPYTLFTDVDDEELLAFLDTAASAAEEAYFARYGRLPSGNPFRSAVLFDKRDDYQSYSASSDRLASAAGHASRGVLIFYVEGRSRVALARTLVHEITHLLNARALAWQLPVWLEEGLATDLGSIWIESSPDVAADPLVGDLQGLSVQGLEARIFLLEQLLETQQLPPVGFLLNLDREAFYRSDLISYSYAHSAALIRYLLEGEDGALAEGFRTFLKRIAGGLRSDLLKLLDRDLDELDAGFRAWLRAEAETQHEILQERARRIFES